MRLPRKNVLPLAGKPVIGHSIEAALQAVSLDRVVVSTDDEEIAQVAASLGCGVLPRPAELARDDSPIDDAYRNALAQLEAADGFRPDIVVGMQGNVPLRAPGEIDELVRRLVETPWATAVATARRVSERPEWMRRIVDPATGEIAPFLDAGERYRKQDLPDLCLLDGASIALRSDVLRRTARDRRVHAYLGDRVLVHVHDPEYSVEIDDQHDLDVAAFWFSRRHTG